MRKILAVMIFVVINIAFYSQTKIVSLAPSLTKILFHLEMEKNIVGVTDYCEYNGKVESLVKEGKIKRVSGFNTINYEEILLIDPDIIIGMDSVSMETKNNIDRLFGKKRIFWSLHPRNFKEIKEQIIKIGKLVGKSDKSDEIVKYMDNELKLIEEKTKKIKEDNKPKILVEIFYPPFTTAGVNTFISDIIIKAGGRLAISVKEDWINVSLEDIITSKPDFIVRTHLSSDNKNLEIIKAYKEKRIFTPSNIDFILQPGVENVIAVKELYNYIYGY